MGSAVYFSNSVFTENLPATHNTVDEAKGLTNTVLNRDEKIRRVHPIVN